MASQRPAPPPAPAATTANSSSNSNSRLGYSVRRNLFHAHLSRRQPANSQHSNTTSAETLRLESEPETQQQPQSRPEPQTQTPTSDIVRRDQNGDYDIGEPPEPLLEDPEDAQMQEAHEDEKERQRLADAVKNHQRDRNRAPSEPTELLEAVKASLRQKVSSLADDNWMYEAEEEPVLR